MNQLHIRILFRKNRILKSEFTEQLILCLITSIRVIFLLRISSVCSHGLSLFRFALKSMQSFRFLKYLSNHMNNFTIFRNINRYNQL